MDDQHDSEQVRELVELLLDRKRADRDLGQHFLIDADLLAHAVSLANLESESHVLEVGPGPGTLTHFLLQTGAKVTAIEIEDEAINHLTRVHSEALESEQLTLIRGDALEVNWPNDITHVVANPPYQISSPLLHKIDEWQRAAFRRGNEPLQAVVLLLQEEFAIRLAMAEGSVSRGPLGIKTALNWKCQFGIRVPPHRFTPHPEINSRFVVMTPHDEIATQEIDVDPRLPRRIVEQAFKERRRKIRNRLKSVPRKLERIPGWSRSRWRDAVAEVLAKSDEVGLPEGWPEMRPEELRVVDWLRLAERLQSIDYEEP